VGSLQLLRINDVCKLLRISKPTLWRLRRASDFPEPTEVTDRLIAWRKSEVEEWLMTRQIGRGRRASNLTRVTPDLAAPVHVAQDVTADELPSTNGARREIRNNTADSDGQLRLPLIPG
jgi:predicted DNA-binding transcriptional regulator AlpA